MNIRAISTAILLVSLVACADITVNDDTQDSTSETSAALRRESAPDDPLQPTARLQQAIESIPDPGGGDPCTAQSSWPSKKSWINLWANAAGRSGTDSRCSQIGQSTTASNPQYVWCRKQGGTVQNSSGTAFNHWWLWTDLDTGGRGWISAYYIAGQGNNQADDMNTHRPIPNCP
jgi:hypothetical protein